MALATISRPILQPALRRGAQQLSASNTLSTVLRRTRPFGPALASPFVQRTLQTSTRSNAPATGGGGMLGGFGTSGSGGIPTSYFTKPSLPANTVVRFVPQQTAWIVERMGKFNRILQPGLAILIPFLDRIAYVKSLKEVAIEIPSQSAITADNVTLELDGVLYTRVFDAYKARYVFPVKT